MSAALDLSTQSEHQLEKRRLKFTIEDYRTMSESGVLPEKLKTELLQGEIYTMLPIGLPHRDTVGFFADLLYEHLPRSHWTLMIQTTIELPEDSAPEPDICVVRGRRRNVAGRHPAAEDYEHIIEVSDTTLKDDRGRKLALYAESQIARYWIVNVKMRQIEAYSDLALSHSNRLEYKTRRVFGENDTVEMTFTDHPPLLFKVSDILSS